MDTKYIPNEILSNPNFNMNDEDNIKELNDTFCEILSDDITIKNTRDYKILIKEINGRIDAQENVRQKKNRLFEVKKELEKAKDELAYYKSLN